MPVRFPVASTHASPAALLTDDGSGTLSTDAGMADWEVVAVGALVTGAAVAAGTVVESYVSVAGL
jgi:hypothetical protein